MRRGVSVSLSTASYLFTLLITCANANSVPYLQPGFSFDFVGSETTVALPVTAQCETISLKWSRKSTAKGPPPIAPYFLQVFSSSSPSPFSIPAGPGPTFDWQVPFAPQTQYQICMYDIQGTSGGCRAIRTMVASSTPNVSCQNVTSLPQLSASTPTDDQSKPITQPRVISQCSDFSVTPAAGTPPFTLTVAPSRHPPVNITSNGRDPIYWTVALGFPFFASLTSSDGLSWSRGPLYVDGQGPSDCLSPGALPKGTFTGATAGAGAGGLMLGAGLGVPRYVPDCSAKTRQEPHSVNERSPIYL
ncbi:hypothetical protein FA13DRAFT_710541 [Coprinellus micaceus]|uniref:Fibronectin type-III domain-containing protein n=1 Tax=Coprinellus micaceus TaxID=71717 RepID=A0A4Y7TWA4_COPMI|nr:hypothetical protein FA13DRAFT_710541 [Coprinellus micaceus]